MRIAYYCQHVLGVGHYHRSREICRACAEDNDVVMIVGGPPVDFADEPFSCCQLPGLKMDEQFSGLHPCDERFSLDEIKAQRCTELLRFYRDFDPHALVIELYPFGRKAFRFELMPLLEAVDRPRCRIVCSLRDILVEKVEGQHKHERRAVDALNNHFDALLVHSDPQLVTLDETFDLCEQIQVPVHYTGFITPKPGADGGQHIREAIDLSPEDKLVVVSIGSGSVGSELLQAVHETARLITKDASYRFHLFTGPYFDDALYAQMSTPQHPGIVVERFTPAFADWLAAADLSISMAGYNTSMNILAAGVPALMMPFDQNREQRLRVDKLTRSHPIRLLEKADLQRDRLIPAIQEQLAKPRYRTGINLDGAARTASCLKRLW